MKNAWLWLLFGLVPAGNALTATFEATGTWDYTDFDHFNNCGDPNPGTLQGTDVIIQNGDIFTLNRRHVYSDRYC